MDDYRDDFYEILGVSHTASASEIREGYIRLSKKNHPDMGGSDRIMQMLNDAYDVLGDPSKRTQYEQWLKSGHSTGTNSAGASRGGNAGGNGTTADPASSAYSAHTSPSAYADNFPAEGILQITTTADAVSMPLICACCLKPSDKAVKFPIEAKTDKNTIIISKIRVPLCKECLKHVRLQSELREAVYDE